jgi:hypothetical protein
MFDIGHQWGTDLSVGPTGDVAMVNGPTASHQRVLRRLLTNPLDYIWQPDYGAGLAHFVGEPADVLQICAVIRGQIFKEASVAASPEPTISVVTDPGGVAGTVYVNITYYDAATGASQLLGFSLST